CRIRREQRRRIVGVVVHDAPSQIESGAIERLPLAGRIDHLQASTLSSVMHVRLKSSDLDGRSKQLIPIRSHDLPGRNVKGLRAANSTELQGVFGNDAFRIELEA